MKNSRNCTSCGSAFVTRSGLCRNCEAHAARKLTVTDDSGDLVTQMFGPIDWTTPTPDAKPKTAVVRVRHEDSEVEGEEFIIPAEFAYLQSGFEDGQIAGEEDRSTFVLLSAPDDYVETLNSETDWDDEVAVRTAMRQSSEVHGWPVTEWFFALARDAREQSGDHI